MHLWFNGHKGLTFSVGYIFEGFLTESSLIKTLFFTHQHIYINLPLPLQSTAKAGQKNAAFVFSNMLIDYHRVQMDSDLRGETYTHMHKQ